MLANFDDNTLYKCLDGYESCHGGSGEWTPGMWRSVDGEVTACSNGLHYCKGEQVLQWLSPDLWLFEDGGTRHDYRPDKCVTDRGRITHRVETWSERTARLFAVDCARIAVNRYARPSQRGLLHACLDVSVGYAEGYCDDDAADAARAAARAAPLVARAAAADAAQAAAWAAQAAARAAADAAQDAAWAAQYAAWAAQAAARAAPLVARAAAADATQDDAWAEQYAILLRYLNGEEGPFVEEEGSK